MNSTRINHHSGVIEILSSDEEEEVQEVDSDSEHSFLEGNVSNAASDSEVDTSSDDEGVHRTSIHIGEPQAITVISDSSDDENGDESEDTSDAASDGGSYFGNRMAVASRTSSSEPDDSDDSECSYKSEGVSSMDEEEEVDASASTAVKFTCPICHEEKSNLSCGTCGHVFCTM